jgi:catechol 2,3-dioxygenase-like lactoylglutathione lyase family enzyme
MIGQATHYGLNVSEMDDALAFYRDTLGFEVDRRFPVSDVQSDIVGVDGVEGEIVFLDAGGFEIELIAYSAPENEVIHETASGHDVGVAHICLTVEDVNGLYEDLTPDVTFVDAPRTVGNGAQIAYARDPDGNYVELYEPPAEE